MIRIPLTDLNTTLRGVSAADFRRAAACGADILRFGQDDSDPLPTTPPAFQFSLAAQPADLPGYTSAYYAHPVVAINLQIPEADLDLVRNWLGATTSTSLVPSDTLQRRMTTAVIGALRTYYADAGRAGLFTRPLRVGAALRLSGGRHVLIAEPRLVTPDATAPLMLIHNPVLSGTSLSTLTEIVNSPVSLEAALPPFSLTQLVDYYGRIYRFSAADVESLDFIATRQVELITGDEQVSGIRTYNYAGQPRPGWHYPRMAEDLVRAAALADGAFRVVASVPIGEAIGGVDALRLPAAGVNLENWTALTRCDEVERPSADDVPDEVAHPYNYPYILRITAPLDLGHPDLVKYVRAVQLRGVYKRRGGSNYPNPLEPRMWLFGGHHRGDADDETAWRWLARTRGGTIGPLRALRYRYLRLAILGPSTDILPALTFWL